MENKTIGIKANYYPEKRNFTELPVRGYVFKNIIDTYRIVAYIYFKVYNKTHPQWLNLFGRFNLGKYDCMHFFNAVSMDSKPWITTFETYLPRGAGQIGVRKNENRYIEKALKALASPYCRKIIAISQHAKEAQIKYLSNYHDEKVAKKIIAKLIVLHPSQELVVNNVPKIFIAGYLELIIVGADFFRKGGLEVLQVIEMLLLEGIKVRLVIVSRMHYGDYASGATKQDLLEANRIIDKYSEIIHYTSKPNNEVIELFKLADIALLPSYGETYGYSVLEAQACGCPVITTNGQAFPEINDNDCGWVIEVPLVEGRSVPKNKTEKEVFQKIVKYQLRKILLNVVDNPTVIKVKGAAAIQRIKNNHSVSYASSVTEQIYNFAIDDFEA